MSGTNQPLSLMALLRQAFADNWDRPALWKSGQTRSYGELWTAASVTAETLDSRLGRDNSVGILAQRSIPAYEGILACILAGRPYVPLNMKAPLERQLVMAQTARCEAFVSDPKNHSRHKQLAAALEQAAWDPLQSAAMSADGARPEAAPVETALDDSWVAYVMFTSGTTGTPKGVAVTRANLLAYLAAISQIAPIPEGAKCSQLFDLSFDLSVHDTFRTWTGGGCLYIMEDEETIDPVGFARRTALDCWFSVPSVVALAARLKRLGDAVLPSLRLSLFCGEALPTALAAAWSRVAPNSRIFNLYGPTEATIAITAHEYLGGPAYENLATVPLGDAFPQSAAVALDEEGNPVEAGVVGELWLGGAQIAAGYINNPAETALRFVSRRVAGFDHDRWYRTGDMVRHEPSNGLIFLGRRDHQVKINGYRVELLDVEAALRRASNCPDVAVIAWPISADGTAEGVVGFVCGSSRTSSQIISACRASLPSYMVPRKVISVERIPVNANGKVDRKALQSEYLSPASETAALEERAR